MNSSKLNEHSSLPDNVFKLALDNALDIVFIMDAQLDEAGGTKIRYVNQAFCEVMGYTKSEVIGKNPRMLQGENTDPSTRAKIREALTNLFPIKTEIINYTKSGDEVWLDINMVPLAEDSGEINFFMAIERDISARKSLEKKLHKDATTDSLTETSNRHHAYQLADQILKQAIVTNEASCTIMLDIDHFKSVNDDFGHPVGDRVLQKLSQIVKGQIRRSDVFGRVGGEEFFLLLCDISLPEATKFADRIRARVADNNWDEQGVSRPVTVSMGVTQFRPADSLESMICRADKALYKAKESGRNKVVAD